MWRADEALPNFYRGHRGDTYLPTYGKGRHRKVDGGNVIVVVFFFVVVVVVIVVTRPSLQGVSSFASSSIASFSPVVSTEFDLPVENPRGATRHGTEKMKVLEMKTHRPAEQFPA